MIKDNLPLISKWADVKKLIESDALSPAEHKLIAAATAGGIAQIGKGVPTTKTDEVLIRAPLLRYLILGGCEKCVIDAVGVPLRGAWITGALDLLYINIAMPITLVNCRFENRVSLQNAQLLGLTLMGGEFSKGLTAAGMEVSGDVQLNNIVSKEGIGFRGASVSGQVDLSGAILESTGEVTLNLDRVKVGGNLKLNNLCADRQKDNEEEQNATVRLMDATISGQLSCLGAGIANSKGAALIGQRMIVKSSFLWRAIKRIRGTIVLSSAHVGDLADDAESWKACEELHLAGFTYDMLHGEADVKQRLAWLKKDHSSDDGFHPQPYEQLAKVLRESGHSSEAREVLVAKERLQRKAAIERRRNERLRSKKRWANAKLRLRNAAATLVDRVFRWTVGYGYKPHYSLITLAGLVSCAWLFSYAAWHAGDFAPNSDVILISDEWQAFAYGPDAVSNPADVWSGMEQEGKDYETFQALAYAVDVVVPLVSLGQEAAWAPSTNRGWWGGHLWWLRWLLIGFGWIATAIGAAAVTGVIRRD